MKRALFIMLLLTVSSRGLRFSARSTRLYPTLTPLRLSSTSVGSSKDEQTQATQITQNSETLAAVNKAIADLEKKRTTISRELERVREDKNAKDQAELILGSLYMIPEDPDMYVIDVMDYATGENVQIRLPEPKTKKNGRGEGGREGAKAFAEARFKQSKKGKRGEGVLEDLLKKIDRSIGVVEGVVGEEDEVIVKGRVEKACNGLVKVKWGGESGGEEGRKKGKKPHIAAAEKVDQGQNYRKYTFPLEAPVEEATHTILVGRNRRQNENLSFRAGKNGDIWMHARGAPGAHVVVKARNRRIAWKEGVEGEWRDALQFAANLAAFYSDLRTERRAEITLAEPKHVVKPRGAPLGAVKLREEVGMILGDPFQVPDECRAAREGGGGGGEEFGFSNLKKKRK
ncbi:hypothetical protein TrST_g9904 [Triparma strigata]|uniref:NFACT RNA-binding domain-containing protein n=1 Tax=Triparma strigata TaxID=1606541 RepID=A0A9W7A4D4_9STRA|nr:hypothetical protein TrST_g9904 [Triparma strigata]